MKLRAQYNPANPIRYPYETDREYEARCINRRLSRFSGRFNLGYLWSPFRINLKFNTVPRFWDYYAKPKPRATRADASETAASES